MSTASLRYVDERDKAYGIAGMAIALVAGSDEEMLAGIAFDAPDGSNMLMSSTINANLNPHMAAKVIWAHSVKELRTVTTMALGNVLCRRRTSNAMLSEADSLKILRSLVREKAAIFCSLDDDEADTLFDNCHSYVRRLFNHSGVQQIADRFSVHIREQRNMSASEIVDYLASLGMR